VALTKHILIIVVSIKILLILNTLNVEGKYLCSDKDNAMANAPPLITWFFIDVEIF
jgi:hypothetical protein